MQNGWDMVNGASCAKNEMADGRWKQTMGDKNTEHRRRLTNEV